MKTLEVTQRLLAHAFQKLGIGSVVGQRTWGGLLAVSRSDLLNDGSVLSMPTQNVRLQDDENEDDKLTNSVENRGHSRCGSKKNTR